MKIKRIVIIITSIVLILLVGAIFFPDKHKWERERLFSKLNEADSVERCESISEQIANLGPDCSWDRWKGGWLCWETDQFYRDYMTSCISSVAVRENNQNLCSNQETNKEICLKQADLVGYSIGESSSECAGLIEDECLLEFISKSKENTTINIDCNSLKKDYRKDNCFELLASTYLKPELCSNILSDYSKDQCMTYLAFRNNDDSLCNNRACEEALDILRNNDISICENINFPYGSSGKESCYFGFALFNRDQAICSKYKNTGPFIHGICERYTK